MTYTSQIILELPLKQFATMFYNHDNLKHWHRGIESIEHVSGEPGEIGAKMKLNYNLKKRKIYLLETVVENNLPYAMHFHYDSKGMHNIQQNYFSQTPEGFTKWVCKNKFIPTNFSMYLMTKLTPKSFKEQTMIYLKDFKNFAEKGISVQHA